MLIPRLSPGLLTTFTVCGVLEVFVLEAGRSNGDSGKGLHESSEPSFAIGETVLTKTTTNWFCDMA